MNLHKNFSLKFLILLILFPLFSCSSDLDVNEAFQEKYGKQIDKMRAKRTPTKDMSVKTPRSFSSFSIEEDTDFSSAADIDYYAYVDVSKFGDRTPKVFLPNGQIYEQSAMRGPANSLPPNIFDVTYQTGLYPPFQKIGAEFDQIEVPERDAYGVKTKVYDKSYLLAGNNSLQKNIDNIQASRTPQDIENSKILISEQRQLRRKRKIIKIFGENSLEIASLEKPQEEAKEVGEKKEEEKSEGTDNIEHSKVNYSKPVNQRPVFNVQVTKK